jgi:hypothetical protein
MDGRTAIDSTGGLLDSSPPDLAKAEAPDAANNTDTRLDDGGSAEATGPFDVPSRDSSPDVDAKVSDSAPDAVADLAPDLGPDLAPDAPLTQADTPSDRADSNTDAQADVPADVVETGPESGSDAPDAGPDSGPIQLDAQADGADAPQAAPCLLTASPWAKAWPVAASTYPASIATAPDGTPWVGGRLYGAVDFGAGPVPYTDLTGVANGDGFLVKLDPQTGLASASFGFGDVNGSTQAVKFVASASNSTGTVVVVGGNFANEIDFTGDNSDGSGPTGKTGTAGLDFLQNPSTASFYAMFSGSSTGTYPIVIKAHKIDLALAGNLKAMASNPGQKAVAICANAVKAVPTWTDSNGGLISVGTTATYGGGNDIVVSKISTDDGKIIWGKQFGGTGDQNCSDVAINSNGDVIVLGSYKGDLDFHGSTTALPTAGNAASQLFLAKLSGADGAGILAKTWVSVHGVDNLHLAVDGGDNVFLAGATKSSIDFGGGVSLSSLGDPSVDPGAWPFNAFVVKLSNTLVPQWGKLYGGATGDQQINALATTSTGDLLVAGRYIGSLGDLGVPVNSSLTVYDAFIAQFTADGHRTCAQPYGDVNGTQSADSLAIARAAAGSAKDRLLVGGSFSSTIKFGSNQPLDSGSASTTIPFISRLAAQ